MLNVFYSATTPQAGLRQGPVTLREQGAQVRFAMACVSSPQALLIPESRAIYLR
jgi:hypothetical protein